MSDDLDEMFRDPTLRRSFTEKVGGPPAKAEALPALPRDMKEYEPWGQMAGGRTDEGCTVYGWFDGTTVPIATDFPWRLYMGCDLYDDTELRILLPHRVIVIHGQKLDDLRQRLRRYGVSFIQQYHSGIWHGLQCEHAQVTAVEILGTNDTRKHLK